MKKLLFAILVFSLSLVQSVFAAELWTGAKTVTGIQTNGTAGFVVYFDSTVNSACTTAGTNSIYIYSGYKNVDDAGLNLHMSMILTALTTGKEVSVLYDDSTSKCYGKFVNMT